jgi:hypothetical protein
VADRNDEVGSEVDELSGQFGKPFRPTSEPAILDGEVLLFDVSAGAEPLPERFNRDGPAPGAMWPIRQILPAGCAFAASGAARKARTIEETKERRVIIQ